ncbi:MAG: hypothetical protein HYV60_18550 [Planctomycetia bacterium]|nr:hypothetical protein [Planctomycetia bacterium]
MKGKRLVACGVKGSGVFFGNRGFKLMRRLPKKTPDPVRLRPTVALRIAASPEERSADTGGTDVPSVAAKNCVIDRY